MTDRESLICLLVAERCGVAEIAEWLAVCQELVLAVIHRHWSDWRAEHSCGRAQIAKLRAYDGRSRPDPSQDTGNSARPSESRTG